MDSGFYKDKAWDMLLEDIKAIKDDLKATKADVIEIKEKMRWVFGFAAGITLAVNIAWVFLKEKITRIVS